MDEISQIEQFQEILTLFIPDYSGFALDFTTWLSQFFAAGVLLAFLLWVVGFSVYSIYSWLGEISTREQ